MRTSFLGVRFFYVRKCRLLLCPMEIAVDFVGVSQGPR